MALWEYKVITSGKGGFATPALLEKFLNDLGRDEWEIVHFQTPPENFLAFTGVVRRSTQRDWTLQDAAAAAAKAEAEKLRAEFEAKFKAAASQSPVAGAEERAPTFLEEKAAPDDGFRKPVDTSRDDDPDAEEDDKADDWDKLTAAEEDDLPTFFEAIKPHLRRNQRGLGMSVGVDYLAKKWDQSEEDLKGALAECGFAVPGDEDAKPEYLEYDGDLFWLNVNRRGELWINTKEKPRPIFRAVKAQKIVVEEPAKAPSESPDKPDAGERKPDSGDAGAVVAPIPAPPPARNSRPGSQPAELPAGPALLDKIRPHMRRNRRGPGGSGSTSFLARALRTNEADLKAAFAALGLAVPASPDEKPAHVEVGGDLWWLNLDSRGGLWINGREKKEGETAAAANAAGERAAEPEISTSEPTEAGSSSTEPATKVATTAEPAVESGDAAETITAPAAGESTRVPAITDPAGTPEETATAATAESGVAPVSGRTPASDGVDSVAAPAAETVPVPLEPVSTAPLTEAPPTPPEETPVPSAEPETPNRKMAAPPPVPSGYIAIEPAPEMYHAAESRLPSSPTLTTVRALLKETKAGAMAGRTDGLAEELGKSAEEFLGSLVEAGLKVPEKPREKPVYVEHVGEILWLSRNAKGELWLNAKASKYADKDVEIEEAEPANESGDADAEKKAARRPARPRTKKAEEEKT